ncbi:universal stress protein [Natronorubrum aibiense]|uniref:Universal stress protein n=1 Tax=Natronorubrum aibiense TaxID=348826 RepID=A0A5P9P965_9EURY|nr:universal stress protein [Natronorubrum aibiense]QFU84701.1 universal stress protein [Natronorubrum aibiense]
MEGHILVPVDQSPHSSRALEYAIEAYPEAEITALHVVDISNYQCRGTCMYHAKELLDRLEQVEQTVFEIARQTATEHGSELTTKLKLGSPVQTIIDYATAHDVDHIVIGSHGRTGFDRLFVGSVAEAVVRQAPAPVTVVRAGRSLAIESVLRS